MTTHAQLSVKHCLDMLAPFDGTDRQSEEGQLQFYQFMTSIYREMYKEPEAYMVFPAPYEEYIIRKTGSAGKKEKEHGSDSRESTLRNTFQQAIQFYASYFYHLGTACSGIDERSGALMISKEAYLNVLDKMNRIHGSKYNAARYEVLTGLGIQIYENSDVVYVGHKTNKSMMQGLLYLCGVQESKYKWMNYLRLDYKNAYSPAPSIDDICKTLSDESAESVRRLEANLKGMKIRTKVKPLRGIVSDFKWKVEYSYKGKNICGFYADNEYFMLCIYFNHFQNISEFAKALYEEDLNLFQWYENQFPERLCKCPSNRRVYFGESSRRICGLSNRAEIVNPDREDLEKALYILRKYRKIDG